MRPTRTTWEAQAWAGSARLAVTCVGLLVGLWGSAAKATDNAPTARGDPTRIEPGKLHARFAKIPFGEGTDRLLARIGEVARGRLVDQLAATPDQHERDRLKQKVAVFIQDCRDSEVAFKGQRTGYNVSVVGTEFAHKTGERMLVAPFGRSHDYYFLINGKLWKVLTTETTETSFPVFLINLTQLYGAPAAVTYRDPETREQPTRAVWHGAVLDMDVEARPDFGTIVVRWIARETQARLSALRGGILPPASGASEGLDPSILDIMKD